MKAYLLALEVQQVEMNKTYEGLPLHCTLVHWFRSVSIDGVTESIQRLLSNKDAPILVSGDEEEFTGMTKRGPIPVLVNKVKNPTAIVDLHEEVVKILDGHKVEYTMPQYIHAGYVPHITHQKERSVKRGESVRVSSLYLAEADDPAYGNDRTIINKFMFRNQEAAE